MGKSCQGTLHGPVSLSLSLSLSGFICQTFLELVALFQGITFRSHNETLTIFLRSGKVVFTMPRNKVPIFLHINTFFVRYKCCS